MTYLKYLLITLSCLLIGRLFGLIGVGVLLVMLYYADYFDSSNKPDAKQATEKQTGGEV